MINRSGLKAMYQAEKGDRAQDRIENLDQLLTAINDFIIPEDAEEMTPLNAFLSHAALEAGESQAAEHEDAVQLMTLHSAKGLEFPLVLIAGGSRRACSPASALWKNRGAHGGGAPPRLCRHYPGDEKADHQLLPSLAGYGGRRSSTGRRALFARSPTSWWRRSA